MDNLLLQANTLPPFSRFTPALAEPAINTLIERNQAQIDALLAANPRPDWAQLAEPMEQWSDELNQAWSPVSHLNSVCNTAELREAYNACIGQLSAHGTWLGQHEALFQAYSALAARPDFDQLDVARRTTINQTLRDFRLAGVALAPAQRERFAAIRKRLSELSTQFNENVLDATKGWQRHITDASELAGLPETALAGAKQAAEQASLDGYLITLDFPSYFPVLNYCDNADLRREVYEASATRASDQGPNAGQWDNGPVMEEILALRQEQARLLGFAHYGELSLATKMAENPEQVLNFLRELAARSKAQAQQEWQELRQFARDEYQLDELQAWDVPYYSEKLRQAKYAVSQEEIRPYLPADRALQGLFELTQRLFGIAVVEVTEFDRYHPDVRLFELQEGGKAIARFYLDLYARADKRGGAWMDECRVRRLHDDKLQLPVAYLVCNFTPPVGDTPALLTHQELTTLFHEFGHGIHHMMTEQTVAAVSGINGVAWDAVELPSQFLENWCWEPEALAFISGHFETSEPLPAALLEKMLAARNFQSAMQMIRQLEFALFDFRLHSEYEGEGVAGVLKLLEEVRDEVAVIRPPQWNRFSHSFSHIFAGGYAAGYYSYKWAEVLSADAYSRFEEEGIFNKEVGAAFRHSILARGGSEEAQTLFREFRGRDANTDALLRHSGIG